MAESDPMPIAETANAEAAGAPFGGTRAEAIQRLQVGLSGLAAMVLLVGLANIIQDRAQDTVEISVPDNAAIEELSDAPTQPDPLADAGVVPDLPAEPEATLNQETALVPELGEDAEPQ